jgi:DNA replication protein DnaC
VLAVRADRRPTSYAPCPECQTAAWAVERRRGRLNMDVPPRFRNCRLDTFPTTTAEQSRIVALLRTWLLDDQPSWLFLWGPTGRGKTGLAAALLYELCARQSTAFQITTDLLSTIKATFGDAEGESESSILEFLYSVDVFCLDDLGSEHHRGPEDWTAEKIFQLIGGRHAALKRTIITSNYSLDQLQDKLGHPRTVRRIVEATTPRWIVDFRRLPSISS